ncbi:ly6/PLAUR domain-containing protein 3 [Mantella aurantiaca]
MKSEILCTFSVTIMGLVAFLDLKGVQAESINCYSCTDQGDGSCFPDKAANVSCPPDHDMCVETITAIRTSHDNHVVLKKGCGYGGPTRLEKNILAYGISIYMQLSQCNSSMCNTDMDLKNYRLAPENNVTHVPIDDQCYSCVGTTKAECSPSSAPVMQCYDTYSHCYDGNVTISIDNDTTVIPIKGCATRYRCGKQSLTYGSMTTEMIGACCSEGLCNSDLSNKTHLAELPYLVLLNEQNEEMTTVLAPPQWLPPEREATPTNDSRSAPQNSEDNAANGLSFSLWLILLLITLS